MNLSSLTHRDALRCLTLVEECTELWDNPAAWQDHLTTEIERLVGGFGGMITIVDLKGGFPWNLQSAWIAQNNSEELQNSFTRFMDDSLKVFAPSSKQVASKFIHHGHFAWDEKSLVGRQKYLSSEFFQQYLRTVHIADVLGSVASSSEGLLIGNSVFRGNGEHTFRDRQTSILSFLNQAIAARAGTTLRLPHQMQRRQLTRRQKEVLRLLLSGCSEKRIAQVLDVSKATAHEHIGNIYLHFKLHSRAELMAAYIDKRLPD